MTTDANGAAGSRITNGIIIPTGQPGKPHGLRLSPSWVRISPSPIMKEMILTAANSAKNIVNGKVETRGFILLS